MLDNDETGYKATRAIELEYSYRVRDFSHNYRGYSDLNDYQKNVRIHAPERASPPQAVPCHDCTSCHNHYRKSSFHHFNYREAFRIHDIRLPFMTDQDAFSFGAVGYKVFHYIFFFSRNGTVPYYNLPSLVGKLQSKVLPHHT